MIAQFKITSVCLIYFPESTADSKKSLGGINIPNTVSKSFNRPPIILKFSRSEISMVIEISIDFNLLGIVEFQIYHFILPILQANLGKKMAKILSRRAIYRNHITNQKTLYAGKHAVKKKRKKSAFRGSAFHGI